MVTLAASTLAAVTLAPAVNAQTSAVWPPAYATRPGDAGQLAPFSISGAHRWPTGRSISTFEAATLPFGAGSRLQGIAYRRTAIDGASYPRIRGEARVFVGTVPDASIPSSTVLHVFAPDPDFAFKGLLDLPAEPPPAAGQAAPFSLVIPFLVSWTYPGGDLGVDVHFEAPPGGVWVRDALRGFDGQDARATPLGPGCAASNGTVPLAWLDATLAVPGGGLVADLIGAPDLGALGTAVHLLGFTYEPPIALEAFGFPPGCRLHVGIVDAFSVATGDRSTQDFARARVVRGIPGDASLTGVSLGSQWLVYDPALTTRLPLLLSNGLRVTLGRAATSPGVLWGRTLWAYGNTTSRERGLELSPADHVAITRFSGVLVP